MMVAIPELDGATAPMVFGGRLESGAAGARARHSPASRAGRAPGRARRAARPPAPDRARRAQGRDRAVQLPAERRRDRHGRVPRRLRVAVQHAERDEGGGLRRRGARLASTTLRDRILDGNAERYGTGGQRRRAHLRSTTTSGASRISPRSRRSGARRPAATRPTARSIFVLGERFGDVLVGVQPAMGYEGDPMRLLFERGFAPTHAFSAFYRYLREDFGADAMLHFGMHGALEFMPGKQVGMSAACWPERLIGALPNVYLYAANNPSEGALAKRRSAATLVSYLTPEPRAGRPLSRADRPQGVARAIPRDRARGERGARAARRADPVPGGGRSISPRPSRPGARRAATRSRDSAARSSRSSTR